MIKWPLSLLIMMDRNISRSSNIAVSQADGIFVRCLIDQMMNAALGINKDLGAYYALRQIRWLVGLIGHEPSINLRISKLRNIIGTGSGERRKTCIPLLQVRRQNTSDEFA